MKLYEAFFLAFLCSLLAGASLFLGIPFICGLIMSRGDISIIDSELTFIFLAMFMIYAVIQFILSIINLVQSIYFDSQGLLYIQGRHVLRSFVIAEVVLYLTIFTSLIALIREIDRTHPRAGSDTLHIRILSSVYCLLYGFDLFIPAFRKKIETGQLGNNIKPSIDPHPKNMTRQIKT